MQANAFGEHPHSSNMAGACDHNGGTMIPGTSETFSIAVYPKVLRQSKQASSNRPNLTLSVGGSIENSCDPVTLARTISHS